MAHSIEARLPFLDYRLVTLLFNLSAEWKLSGPLNKFILREAMRERIPESVRTRQDKMGFPTPIGQWFRTSLFKQMRDVLMSQEARERGIYNVSEIIKDFERHQAGRIDASQRLFNVAQLEMWHRILKKPLGVPG
jgi:asparagine synthase (glutamine-hydrolysing)